MRCVFGDDPGVDPDIGSLIRNDIFQVRVFFGGINGLAGIDNAQSRLVSDHFIPHLINHIGLHQGLLGNQKILGFLQFLHVCGVGGIAQIFQGDAEGIPDGILHQDAVFVFAVPEDFPACYRLVHHGFIV